MDVIIGELSTESHMIQSIFLDYGRPNVDPRP